MSDRVRFGILGAGTIAHKFMAGIKACDHAEAVAAARRDRGKAKAFAEQHGIAAWYDDYDALLADANVEAVYIATPHPQHAQWAVRAAQAGKHVLTEKPAAMNQWEVMAMVEVARRHNVLFMEAFKDRVHPVFLKLFDLIRQGAIGDVVLVDAAFGFPGKFDAKSRLYDPALGGGGMLDVGSYPMQFARAVAGVVAGKAFDDPVKVTGVVELGESGVDEAAVATLRFASGMLATITTSLRANLNWIKVHGRKGCLVIPGMAWHPAFDGGTGVIEHHHDGKTDRIEIAVDKHMFAYQIDAAATAIRAGKPDPDPPAMGGDDAIGQARTIDQWRHAVGLTYPADEEAGRGTTIDGRPLKKRDDAPMVYGRVDGIDQPISRFIMGCDNQTTFAHAAVMFDAWIEAGGNAFDTAHIYGGGHQERLLGRWMRSRGVKREDVVIIGKTGHTPRCRPEAIRRDLDESLERLGVGYLDFHILHRDNLALPVGELVDVLDELHRAGKLRVAGGSNWTLARFAEANAYAEANGRHPLGVLNNNLSLAMMIEPVWAGCVHASDRASLDYLAEHRVAHLAWSSQARGYFTSPQATGRVGVYDRENAFDYPVNQQRRQRAFALAERLGVSALNVAAAYVLNQPFPSFALIGPRNPHEITTALPALKLQLTPRQLAYLALEADSPD